MPRSAAPSQSGFTLIEVMVGFVLVFVLMLGLNALWTQVGAQFDDLVYRQKAIFRLNGEMERLTAQYKDQGNVVFSGPANDLNAVITVDYTKNVPADAGSFISTSPGATSLPNSVFPLTRKIYYGAGVPGFVLNSTVPADLAKFTALIPQNDDGTATRDIYNYILSNYSIAAPSTSRNVVWLDQTRQAVAQLSWDFYQLPNTNTGSAVPCYQIPSDPLGSCYLMTVYIDYPFRFDINAGAYAPIPGIPVETITAQTILGKVRKL